MFHLLTRALRFVMACTMLFATAWLCACGSDDDEVGTQCCALQKYCENCEYCSDDERTIANNEDESACKSIIDEYLDGGQYCSPTDQTLRTKEFLAACS
jgi:hypothetical protein